MTWGHRAYKFVLRDWSGLRDLDVLARVLSTARFTRNLQPVQLDGPVAGSIVVIAPHPDDEVLGAGGTLIRAIAAGARVTVVYLTDGKPPAATVDETRRVAERLGYATRFLSLPLNAIPVDDRTAGVLREAVMDGRPNALFVPFLADDHDDHRRANHLLLRALGSEASLPDLEVWAYQVYTMVPPNVVVDVTDVAESKASAIRMWSSKRSRDWVHFALGLNAYNSRFIETQGRPLYVEAFFVVPLKEYLSLCRTYFETPGTSYYFPSYRAEDGGIAGDR